MDEKRLEEQLSDAREVIGVLSKALDYIDHELGRPRGLGMPAPIVNASDKAQEALESTREKREKLK